jgi:hypothetical protein
MHGNVAKSCDMSLASLGEGIEYIDLMLLHCTILLFSDLTVRADFVQS